MKIKIEKKYIHIGVMIFFTVLALMFVFFLIYRFDSLKLAIGKFNKIMAPVFYGFFLAYIINPIMNFVEKKIIGPLLEKYNANQEESKRKKATRAYSLAITIIFVLLLIYLFFVTLIPQVYKSLQSLIQSYPVYIDNLTEWLNKVTQKNPEIKDFFGNFIDDYSSEAEASITGMIMPVLQKFLVPNINTLLSGLSASIVSFVKLLINIIIGIIISVYVLFSKEKFANAATKFAYAILETKNANRFLYSIRYTHRTFIGFLSGKVLDSAIIGLICYICCLILGMPYSLLISVVVGVTNIIPVFGPFFGAIPSTIIILMVEPKKALTFVIFILILQQFDGNILGPKVLAGSTGISSFGVIFAITLFGGWLGVFGMIIGVPIVAVCYTGLRKVINSMLRTKNLPTETASYSGVGEISETGEITPYVYVDPNMEAKQEKRTAMAKAFRLVFLIIWKAVKYVGGLFKLLFIKLFSFTKVTYSKAKNKTISDVSKPEVSEKSEKK